MQASNFDLGKLCVGFAVLEFQAYRVSSLADGWLTGCGGGICLQEVGCWCPIWAVHVPGDDRGRELDTVGMQARAQGVFEGVENNAN